MIFAFAAAILFSVWIAAWGAAKLAKDHPLLAGFFASSGVRMVAPFIIVLVVVVGHGRIAPIESVYYVVPLYLCMLTADVFIWVREIRKRGPAEAHINAKSSTAYGEVT